MALISGGTTLIYDTATGEYHNYTKSQITNLINSLQNADLIVGFNQLNFDYKILSTYIDTDLEALPNFDMLNEIEHTLNFRVSRDNLAQNTLNEFNSKERSTNNVEITKELFKHACKKGHLFYHNTRLDTKAMCDTSDWADTARNMAQKTRPLIKIMAPSENLKQDYNQTTKFQDAKPISAVNAKKEIENHTNSIVHRQLSHDEYLEVDQIEDDRWLEYEELISEQDGFYPSYGWYEEYDLLDELEGVEHY